MPRTPTINAQGNVQWKEKASSPDGDNLVITLELDAVDSGSGFVQQETDSSNVSWLDFTTSSIINSDGTRDVTVTIEVDPNGVSAGNDYRFELIADDGNTIVSRKIILSVISALKSFFEATQDGNDDVTIHQYEMSTRFDVSSAGSETATSPLINWGVTLRDMTFKPDGTRLYLPSADFSAVRDGIWQYDLNTKWDISTLQTPDSGNIDLGGISNSFAGITISSDGSKLMTGNEPDLLEFDLSTSWDVTSASFVQRKNEINNLPGSMSFGNGGNKLLVGDTGGIIYEFDLGTAYTLDTITEVNTFSVSSNTVTGIGYNNDGTKLFVLDSGSGEIYEFSLSTPYDTSSRSQNSITIKKSGSVSAFFI